MHQYRGRRIALALAIAAALLNPLVAAASQTAPDNTKVNKRDRHPGQATADQQKENTSDREIARRIRRALMNDKSLSTYAHNVKVIAQDGRVTLKGPVRTEEEKHSVEAKAREVAGAGHVVNQISIAPSKASKN